MRVTRIDKSVVSLNQDKIIMVDHATFYHYHPWLYLLTRESKIRRQDVQAQGLHEPNK